MTRSMVATDDVPVTGRLDRARQVLLTLHRHGFGPARDVDEPVGPRLRAALTELGTTAVKLGQFLGQRPDLVGNELAAELEALHDDVAPESTDSAFATFEETVGDHPEAVFGSISAEPLAAGSIGQVYEAELPGGREVVVKIRRRGIKARCAADLAVLEDLARMTEVADWAPHLDLPDIVERFRRTLAHELDFRLEAANLQQFRATFAGDSRMEIPAPVEEASSEAVLTMTRIDGVPWSDPDALRARTDDPEGLVELGVGLVLDMVLAGCFHADPHPGNLFLVGPDTLGVVDFGMVGWLSQARRQALLHGVRAFRDNDADGIAQTLLHLTDGDPLPRGALTPDVRTLLQRHRRQSMADVNVNELLNDVVSLLREHGRTLRGNVALLLRCVVVLDGTARNLCPDYDLAAAIDRWSSARKRERLGPWGAWLWKQLPDLSPLVPQGLGPLEELPEDVQLLLQQLERGDLTVRVKPVGLERAVHRMTIAIVNAAVILGATMMMANRVPPVLWDMSISGLVLMLLGLCAAGITFLAMWLDPEAG